MRAAVLQAVGDETVEVRDDVEVVGPGPGEVRVAIRATGVCHSDLSAMNGTIPQPTPAVLGHEGAGEVVAVGEGVGTIKLGDHVIVVWVPPCGTCRYCLGGQPNLCTQVMYAAGLTPRFVVGGSPAYGFAGTGTFAEEVVLPVQGVVAIDKDVPWEIASLLGCGVVTGVGAAINAAKIRPGSSVLVYGCGGVGMAVIQGARIAGAAEIVAVDRVEAKLDQARRFGATHAVVPERLGGPKDEITEGDGFDYAFEVIGRPETIRAAYDNVRRGGTAVVVGAGRAEETVELNAFELFYSEKTLKGTIYGSADVRTDFHRLLRLWKAGRLDLEGMISDRLDLSKINEAFAKMRAGEAIRQVIHFGGAA
ncbi:MAG: Zn-dependent alcohol dehydrogenase [Actinomycetota bacterium]|nr:Zn-dependent alcohol dehydrogenase [Actinomycetota bacterium]